MIVVVLNRSSILSKLPSYCAEQPIFIMLNVLGLNNAWMVDCLYTPDAADRGSDIDVD